MSDSPQRRFRLFEQIFNLTFWVPFLRPGMSVPGDTAGGDFRMSPASRSRSASGQLRRSLRLSTTDGIFSEVVTAFTQGSVLTAWALFVGGGTIFIGVLAAMPFLSQLCHLPGAWITAAFGRKRVTCWATMVGRQSYWLLIPLPFLNLPTGAQQAVVLSVALLQGVLGVIGNNAWVSWMGDMVPSELRGRYFGLRNAFATLGGTVAALVAGVTIDAFERHGGVGIALSMLSVVAAVSGMVTSYCLWRQHEPASTTPSEKISLQATFRPFIDAKVRPFLTYQAGWNFSVALASSFIPVHMVKNLHMGYSLVAVHAASLAMFRIVASPLWGRVLDKVGARPILIISSFGICALPFIWLFPTETMLWPIFIDAFVSGTLWAGHAVAIFALPFSIAPPRGRPFYLGAFNATAGIFFALAAMLAGAIADSVPETYILFGRPMVNIHLLFALSFVARLGAAMMALRLPEPDAGSVRDAVRIARGQLRSVRLGLPTARR